MIKLKKFNIVILTLLLLSGFGYYTKSQVFFDDHAKHTMFGISFPPVQHQDEIEFSVGHLKKLGVDRVRISTQWEHRELEKGVFNWEPLDQRINTLVENGIQVLLTVETSAPEWVCSDIKNSRSCIYQNSKDFKEFISQLANRYGTKLSKVQYGNEWDSKFWFVGTEREFVEYTNIFYEEFKKTSDNIDIVLGGLRSVPILFNEVCEGSNNVNYPIYFPDEDKLLSKEDSDFICDKEEYFEIRDRVLFVLQNAKFDIVDLHIYDDIENWKTYYSKLQEHTDKPIIVTEFGIQEGGFPPKYVFNEGYEDRVYKSMKVIDDLKINEAYYFKLVDDNHSLHSKSGLIDGFLREKQSYFIFKNFIK